MKVLHLGKYYSPFEGGIENFLSALLKETAGQVENIVHVHHHQSFKKSRLEKRPEGVIFRSFTICKLLFAPISPFFYVDLKRLVEEYRPDLVHIHMPNLSAFWILLLLRRYSMPVVVHWHADIVPSSKNILLSLAYIFYRPLETRLLKRSDAVIATSPAYLDSSGPLEKWRDKCHVIPLALSNVADSAPVTGANPDRTWKQEGDFKVLCVGRLTYYKGQNYLIEAVSRMDGVELIIVGTGKYQGRYKALVSRLGCGDRVRLFGHATRGELDGLMASCDCLCLPSIERTEAFGLVLLEAMARSKACICTDVAGSGMNWVVRDEETGLVVESGNVDSLKKGLSRLQNDQGLTETLGRAGFARFTSLFTMDKVAGEILRLYNRLTN